jgi:hypothetical protein
MLMESGSDSATQQQHGRQDDGDQSDGPASRPNSEGQHVTKLLSWFDRRQGNGPERGNRAVERGIHRRPLIEPSSTAIRKRSSPVGEHDRNRGAGSNPLRALESRALARAID